MGQRQRQGICGIARRNLVESEHRPNHLCHLALVRMPATGDCALDAGGLVLSHLNAYPNQTREHDATRVPQLGGCLGVLVKKERLNGTDIRLVILEDLAQLELNSMEPLSKRFLGVQNDHAMGNVANAIPIAPYDAPSEAASSRVDADCNHHCFN